MWSSFVNSFFLALVICWSPLTLTQKCIKGWNKGKSNKVFQVDWFCYNSIFLQSAVTDFGNKPNISCLELGSFEGLTSNYLMENICNGPHSLLVSIDTWEGSKDNPHANNQTKEHLYKAFRNNVHEYIDAGKLIPIRKTSRDGLIHLLNTHVTKNHHAHEVSTIGGHTNIPTQFDFIYLDASHFAKDTLLDLTLAFELLKVGGIMGIDDYEWTWGKPLPSYATPKPAVDAFLEAYKSTYELLVKGYQVHIKKNATEPAWVFD